MEIVSEALKKTNYTIASNANGVFIAIDGCVLAFTSHSELCCEIK